MWETIANVLWTGLGVLLAGLAIGLWPHLRALLPAWATGLLTTLADVFVRAVEGTCGAGGGPTKYQAVLERLTAFLQGRGIAMEEAVVRAAIEAAWQRMNAEQVAAGIKGVAEDAE